MEHLSQPENIFEKSSNIDIEQPKWVDEEDDQIQISLNKKNNLKKLKKEQNEDFISSKEFQARLRTQFDKMNGNNQNLLRWATELPVEENLTDDEENQIENLLKTNTDMLSKNALNDINSQILQITQLSDLNKDKKHGSVISALEFHPEIENICFSAGLDKKLKIFSINNTNNERLNVEQSLNKTSLNTNLINQVYTTDIPIHSAKFLNKNEIIIGGRRKHYLVYNLEKNTLNKLITNYRAGGSLAHNCDKIFVDQHSNNYCFGTDEGYIFLYDSKTKTFKHDIKIAGSVNTVCFDRSNNMYCAGDQGEIYIFDLRKYRSCLGKITDTGNFNTLSMDISPDNNWLATSSSSGFVNLFDINKIQLSLDLTETQANGKIEPVKSFKNLTTSCEFLKFSRKSNKLGFCSKWKKFALKVANLNSLSCYSNFPNYTSSIKYPLCLDFSVNDKYFAIGNDEGRVFLYKLDN